MILTLRVSRTDKADQEQRHEICLTEGEQFTIGRTDCDLVLTDGGISRRHLRLIVQKQSLIAQDLNSRNGTFYRNKKVTSLVLGVLDVLNLGNWNVSIEKIAKEEPKGRPAAKTVKLNGFTFLREGKFDSSLIILFYRNAFQNWKTFWQNTPFNGIPIEHSLIVLSAVCLVIGASTMVTLPFRMSFMPLTLGSIFLWIALANMAGYLLLPVTYHFGNEFIRAKGNFAEYLSYTTYLAVLSIPCWIVGSILGSGGSTLTLILMGWSLWGFYKRFNPDLTRLIILWVGLSILASSAATFIFMSWVRSWGL